MENRGENPKEIGLKPKRTPERNRVETKEKTQKKSDGKPENAKGKEEEEHGKEQR